MKKETIEFHYKSTEESPGYLLGQLTLIWQRKQKMVLDPLDLTQTQFVLLAALAWLSKTKDNVNQVDIAVQCNFDRMMVSKVLRTLEEKGFLTRAQHVTDTRAKTIRLTQTGGTILQKALTAIENIDVEFFGSLNDDLPAFNKRLLHLIKTNSA